MKFAAVVGITIAACISDFLYAQNVDYLDYHRQRLLAERHVFLSDFPEALVYYQSAFQKAYPAFAKDLFNAALCAALSGDTVSLATLMVKGMQAGVPFARYANNSFFNVYSSFSFWERLQNDTAVYARLYRGNLNADYRKILDSLNVVDQAVRKHCSVLYRRPNSAKAENKWMQIEKVDAEVRQSLVQLIRLHGYPNERNVGFRGQSSVSYYGDICVWHRTDSAFIRMEKDAFLHGELDVERYVSKMEYAGVENYCYFYGISKKNDCNQAEIDSKREFVGFPTTQDFQLLRFFYKETGNKYGFVILYSLLK